MLALFCSLFFTHNATAEIVDIMLVYDTTATTWVNANGGMAVFSQDAVNRMNQAMQNSGSSHSLRLVHSMSVQYTTTSNGSTPFDSDLTWLQSGTGESAAVHTARETYRADLVAMLVNTGSAYGYVGIGNLLYTWSGAPDSCFTVSAIQSVNISHTLTHEIGHNLGAHHAKNQKLSPGPNPYLDNQYSAGWYFTGTNSADYHTIMAYNNDGYDNSYLSAPLFSTPLVTWQGTSAGHSSDGDNTRLIDQTFPTVAAYRNSESTLTSLTISGPTSVNGNTSATYTTTATWSDGSTSTVTPTWSEDSVYTEISSSGVLSTAAVPSSETVTISASYTAGGVTRTDTHTITVVAVTLSTITINGPVSINHGSSATYTATATWSNGSTSTVTPTWTENSVYTEISGTGVLTTSIVPSSETVIISASYTSGAITRTGTITVSIMATDVPAASPAVFPFTENFESGTLDGAWSISSTGTGRITITAADFPNSGTYHLTMDSSTSGSYALNELILTIDLASREGVVLRFYQKEFGDEDNPMPTTFTDSNNSDGVAISADGIVWHRVQGLISADGSSWTYRKFTIDLDSAVARAGISYNSTFKIKFQQYDNYPIATDGFAFDDIAVQHSHSGFPWNMFLPAITGKTSP